MFISQQKPYVTLGTITLILIAGTVLIIQASYLYAERLLLQTAGQALSLAAADSADKLRTFMDERASAIELLAKTISRELRSVPTVQHHLTQLTSNHPFYRQVGIFGADGHLIAASKDFTLNADQQDKDWFKQAARYKKRTFVREVPPPAFASGEAMTFAISSFIQDEHEKPIGIVIAQIDATTIETSVVKTIRALQVPGTILKDVEYQFLTADGTVFIDSQTPYREQLNLKHLALPSALVPYPRGYVEETHVRRHEAVLSGYADTAQQSSYDMPSWRVLMRLNRSAVWLQAKDYLLRFAAPLVGLLTIVMAVLFWSTARLYSAWTATRTEATRSRSAELALRESEARTRAIIENALDGVAVTNATGEILDWNANAERLFGRTKNEVMGRDLGMFLFSHPDHPNHLETYTKFTDLIQSRTLQQPFEMFAQSPILGAIPVEVAVSTFIAGDHQCFSAFIRDNREQISTRLAQRRAQELAESSAAQKALILNNVDIFFVRLDELGIIREWTPAAERMFSIPAKEALGHSFHSLGLKWRVDDAIAHQCFLKTGQAVNCTHDRLQLVRPEGEPSILRLSIKVINPNQPSLILMGEDVTEHYQLQQEIARAQKWEAIGQLAAGIAHEVNTPTQYILDNTQFAIEGFKEVAGLIGMHQSLVKLTPQDEGFNETLDLIRQIQNQPNVMYVLEEIPKALHQSSEGLTRVSNIVRAMKEFAHPDLKETTLTDVNQCIHTTIEIARNEWKYVADIELDLHSDLPLLNCFRSDLNQVLLNLLINAAHAIADRPDRQRGRITISTRCLSNVIEISVADTGTGIPTTVQDKIFDPFFTTKAVGRGTGQGLSIVKTAVVKKHGGSISFNSQEGVGTTFKVSLPLASHSQVIHENAA